MSLLRATVRNTADWWEMKLLDLNVMVEGESEGDMLRQLEHTLTAYYHLALKFGETPFAELIKPCPPEVSKSWEDGNKKLKMLDLPFEVRRALSAIFVQEMCVQEARTLKVPEFRVSMEPVTARAA